MSIINKETFYLCIEGNDGVGKSTQCALLEEDCISQNISYLLTGEPGSKLLPITMELRKLMLDKYYSTKMDEVKVKIKELITYRLPDIALELLNIILETEYIDNLMSNRVRELIGQATRNIHISNMKEK
jgi:hypothetical protein